MKNRGTVRTFIKTKCGMRSIAVEKRAIDPQKIDKDEVAVVLRKEGRPLLPIAAEIHGALCQFPRFPSDWYKV